jgi:cytochrome oxidase assembly protein ShyY1
MLSRRWALFAVVVVVLAYGCYLLGRWQFHRLHERESANSQIRSNLAADPVAVSRVLSPGRPSPADAEWRSVTATGTYLPSKTVVIRYQTRQGASGVDVATPLRTTAGPLLIVDRGWMQTDNVGVDAVRTPPPPSGTVKVLGWVRADGTGDATTVTDRSARAVSSTAIAKILDGPVYGGFLDAEKEAPAPDTPLVKADRPDLGNGPHFFYGLQWWFFGVLAVFGFFYLAYDEWKRPGRGRPSQTVGAGGGGPPDADEAPEADRVDGTEVAEVTEPSEGAEHAPVDRERHAADEARSR